MVAAFLAKLSPLYSSGFFGVSREKKSRDFRRASVRDFPGFTTSGKTGREKKNSLESREKTQANIFNSRASALGERDKCTDYI